VPGECATPSPKIESRVLPPPLRRLKLCHWVGVVVGNCCDPPACGSKTKIRFKTLSYIFLGIPLVITIIYSILRQNFDNEKCWVSPSKEFWIEWTIIGPCLLVLCVSYAFSIAKKNPLLDQLIVSSNRIIRAY
jgi:hypothetical protein